MSAPLAHLELHLPDEHATDALAEKLAPLVNGANGPAGGRIHLRGDLGAGKTAFTRARCAQAASRAGSKVRPMPCLNPIKFLTYTSITLIFIDLVIRENGWTQDFAIYCVTTPSF
ncbi:tRNA threonylcarbamoyl adenosine modification protein YjeE [Bordetella holmesii CDC-H785-BH]|nr:tRNA threonylcarbamoyl adenosine modification protein YjeE [Bordetella holmesii CDC-H785-BH]